MNSIREDLKAFVDGELAPERMEEVRLAVEADPSLEQEAEFMRVLGLEIKRLAAEPEVVGKEQVVEKFRRPPLKWWDSRTMVGRLAYTFGLFIILGALAAVLFPVFAQSKMGAADAAPTAAFNAPAAGYHGDPLLKSRSGQIANGAPARMPSEDFAGEGSGMAGDETVSEAQAPEMASATNDAASGTDLSGSVFAPKSETEEAKARKLPPTAKAMPQSSPPRAGSRSKPASKAAANTSVPAAPPTNRMVIKNAEISLKVKDAKKALSDSENLAKSLGGYVEGSNHSGPENEEPTASVVLRVPAKLYETAMQALRSYGDIVSENTNAQDVTAANADVEGRLTVLRAEEDSYVTMLRGARKIGELMEIKDRLSQVRQEIASLRAQRNALQNESALSTIRATFVQKTKIDEEKRGKSENGFDETWAKAVNGLSAVGEFLGKALIYLFVFSPVWLPPVVLFWWLGKKAKG